VAEFLSSGEDMMRRILMVDGRPASSRQREGEGDREQMKKKEIGWSQKKKKKKGGEKNGRKVF
jgi:hypothetical protein